MRRHSCAALGALAMISVLVAEAQQAGQTPPATSRTNPAELPKVFAVRITVSDLARSERFYRDGLGAQIRQIQSRESMAQFVTGPGVVLAMGRSDATPQPGGAGGFLLQVVDLDAAIARVAAAGGTVERPPSTGAAPSGVRSAFIRDPDGVGIEVIQFPR
jgi:predicted enzyme related to lactoylglutathione lyase